VFDGQVALLPAANRVNTIAFALKGPTLRLLRAGMERRAERLETALGLPYRQMLRDLWAANEWSPETGFRLRQE
jgi:hypothetical protein